MKTTNNPSTTWKEERLRDAVEHLLIGADVVHVSTGAECKILQKSVDFAVKALHETHTNMPRYFAPTAGGASAPEITAFRIVKGIRI